MIANTVSRLLEPFSFAQFCDAYYEKQPLLIRRRSPSYYDGLLSLEALNAQLGSAELQLVRNGERLDDAESVFARLYDGDPVAISSYERHSAAVLHLRHDLERHFHAPVVTTVFLTPRNAREADADAEGIDTFILQFAGMRKWSVRDGSGKRVMTVTLKPGDFLYVPGDFVREARSTDAMSGHLELGLEKYTYADLLRQIADNAQASVWLRKSLPADLRSVLNGRFLREVHRFFDHADLPAYLERMHSDFAEERLPDSADRLADYVKLPSISGASRFRRRTGLWPELTNGGGQVVLRFHQKELEFPAAAAKSIRFMIDADDFVASALPGNAAENLALCSTLVREGFLTIVG